MTALELVGALAAAAGTGLVLSMVVWIDRETTPATPVTAAARSSQTPSPTPHRQAA
jgi:hypothetical protein